MSWQEEAVCSSTDPHVFYPKTAKETATAKRICFSCDVRDRCLTYALENDERHGIWGGKTPNQRKVLLSNAGTKIQALRQKRTA